MWRSDLGLGNEILLNIGICGGLGLAVDVVQMCFLFLHLLVRSPGQGHALTLWGQKGAS